MQAVFRQRRGLKGTTSAPAFFGLRQKSGRGDHLSGAKRDRMCLLESTQSRPIANVDAREFERAATIVAAPGVKFGAMIGKCEEVPLKKGVESGAGRLQMRFGFGGFSLR